uniref:non-specific serine/threonine protein kinase n=1 Tax=Steinernema glaseri TaxID=37863 RepID=A0A1I8AQJ2_9BILA
MRQIDGDHIPTPLHGAKCNLFAPSAQKLQPASGGEFFAAAHGRATPLLDARGTGYSVTPLGRAIGQPHMAQSTLHAAMPSRELSKQDREARPQVKLGPFVFGKTLGQGCFGKVKLATHERTNLKVAVKIISREKMDDKKETEKVNREIRFLSLLKHPHVVRLYQVISTPSDIFLIMEYISGGDLFDKVVKKGRMIPTEARRYFQQIIAAIDYSHRHMIVHRDLKPENILIDERNNIKIVDFGLSNNMVDGGFMKTACGSYNYAAPELITEKMYMGPEVDIWSCGVILYALLSGTLPFDHSYRPELCKIIQRGIFNIPNYFEATATNLLINMLQVDPLKRATIKDIKNHAWFVVDLPSNLFPKDNESEVTIVDVAAVREVAKHYKVPETEVTTSLLNDEPHHHLCVAYNLILDNKRLVDKAQQLSIQTFTSGICVGVPHPEHGTVPCDADSPGQSPKPKNEIDKIYRSIGEKTWHMGLRSSSEPGDIMREVFRALKECDMEWIIISPYRLIVRRRSADPEVESPKMRLTLYDIKANGGHHYALDFFHILPEESNTSARSRQTSLCVAPRASERTFRAHAHSFPKSMDEQLLSQPKKSPPSDRVQFLDMCAEVILKIAQWTG